LISGNQIVAKFAGINWARQEIAGSYVFDFVKDKELRSIVLHEEKPNGMQEVVGSIPSGSTKLHHRLG
jgi:hypothetical protein